MMSQDAERCARIIVTAAAEVAGLRPAELRAYSAEERLSLAAEVFYAYGALANEPVVRGVLESFRAWKEDPADRIQRELFERHVEIGLRCFEAPRPGPRLLSHESLLQIGETLRRVEERMTGEEDRGELALADLKMLCDLRRFLQRFDLPYPEAAA